MDLFSHPNILKMAEENDYDGLRQLLQHNDPNVRLQAAQALADLGDAGGWRALEEAVRTDSDPKIRAAAAAMLGELGDPRAIPVLRDTLKQLNSPASSQLAAALCRALDMIDTPEAEEALREAGYQPVLPEQHHTIIEYGDSYVKSVTAEAGEIRFLSAETHLNTAVELREAELAERGLVECNIALWMKPDWGYAWYVRGVLLEDLDRPVEALLAYRTARHYDSSHAETREALEEIEQQVVIETKHTEALLKDLGNGSWQERRDAAALLGEMGDDAGAAGLILALQDPEREARHAALEALTRLGKGHAESVVPVVLEMEESSWLLRFARLHTLSEMGSVPGLVSVLENEMDRVQHRNPVFTAGKDPLLEVEYELVQEVGALALERTGDVATLLAIAEENAWVEVDEDEEGIEISAEEEEELEDAEWIDDDMMDVLEQNAEEAEENLESYVDEVGQLAAAALDRLAMRNLTVLPEDILRRLAQVPDLTLLDPTAETFELEHLVTVYDLGGLRSAAQDELGRRGIRA